MRSRDGHVVAVLSIVPKEGTSGAPASYSMDFERRAEELDDSTLDEPWSEYLIAGTEPKIIRTRVVVTRRWIMPGSRNVSGEPFVNADVQVALSQVRPARVDELGV
jgi:hypothetical protein